MWLRVVVLGMTAGLAACAQGACATCPSATLTANDSTDLAAHVGDMIAYAWSSEHADTATSTVAIAPTHDNCVNMDGPWVIDTLQGTIDPSPLLACQSGFTYTLTFTVTQSSTGTTTSSLVTIAVN